MIFFNFIFQGERSCFFFLLSPKAHAEKMMLRKMDVMNRGVNGRRWNKVFNGIHNAQSTRVLCMRLVFLTKTTYPRTIFIMVLFVQGAFFGEKGRHPLQVFSTFQSCECSARNAGVFPLWPYVFQPRSALLKVSDGEWRMQSPPGAAILQPSSGTAFLLLTSCASLGRTKFLTFEKVY